MPRAVRYKLDADRWVLVRSCEGRGWQRAVGEADWNIYWASPHALKPGFRFASDQQVINHFPNSFELTRKDLMVKNIKRYRREVERTLVEAASAGLGLGAAEEYTELDFLPTTYLLPSDYNLFVEEFRRGPSAMWIMKPTSKAQGRGIFIISKLTQIKKWAAKGEGREAYVVSRYIDNPLLIGGKKFDLRIYVLVSSYRPLRVFVHRDGFARLCTQKYTTDLATIDNEYVHLTNVAIQKRSEDYNAAHGGKLSMRNLRLHLEAVHGAADVERLFERIGWIIVHSLKACQPTVISDRHCFELYGYDVMVDDALKPWLIEVNASPSLSASTPADRRMKLAVVSDVLDAVVPPDFLDHGRRGGGGSSATPGLELLYDEVEHHRVPKAADRGRGFRGRFAFK